MLPCLLLRLTALLKGVVVHKSCGLNNNLFDFGLHLEHISLRCHNTSAISLTKNPIMHSRTKHIQIRHHFIRDHIHKGDCDIESVDTDSQLADIFTKPLARYRFYHLCNELVILSESNLT